MPTMFDHFSVFKPDLLVDELPVTPDFYRKLEQRYPSFGGHILVQANHFSEDWPTWEVHPRGDELVILMTGQATFLLHTSEGDESRVLSKPGEYVVVPRGVWHTAKINEACSMLFITPGEGTENRTEPTP